MGVTHVVCATLDLAVDLMGPRAVLGGHNLSVIGLGGRYFLLKNI